MQGFPQKKNRQKELSEKEKEQQSLLEEYYDTLLQLRQIRRAFQLVTDPELISACVYEMNALQQRYSYLLQRVREEGITCMRVLR